MKLEQQIKRKPSAKTSWARRAAGTFAGLAILTLLGGHAQAQSGPSWTGLGLDYLWSNTNNWAADIFGNPPNLVPTDGATVYLYGSPTAPVNYDLTTNVVLRGIYFKPDQYNQYGPWTVNGKPMSITNLVENNLPTNAATINNNIDITGANGGFLLRPDKGDLVFNGVIGGGGAYLSKGNANYATFNGLNTYTCPTLIWGTAALNINSIKNVGGAPNSLGQPTLVNSVIQIGITGQASPCLNYLGAGDTSDRVIAIATTALANGAMLKQSGTGLWKLTGGVTGLSATAQRRLYLDGSAPGVGEIAGPINNMSTTTGGGVQIQKNGPGTWVLSGTNLTTSGTTISAGKLVGVTGGSSSNAACTVAAGATFGVRILSTGANWTQAALTFNASTCYAEFDFGANVVPSTTNAPLQSFYPGNIALNTNTTFIIKAGNLPVGDYALIKNGFGVLSGTPSTTLLLPPRVAATLVTTTGAVGSVVLHVTTGATGDTWTAGNGTWDINNTASWNVGNYLETTLSGDAVLFDDSASGSGPFAVTLDTVVNPIGVTVSNLSKDYTISGLGGIAGWGNLTKQGAGKLTLDTTNAYYGDTVIGAGTLALGGTGSISNTANLNLAAGATFDVSAIASYALPPGSGLIASGTAAASATIKGGTTVSFGSRQVALTFAPTAFSGDPAHPALVISQGTLALGGNGFTVHNAGGTALGDGTYNLINVTSGNVTGVPTVAAVTVTGAGLLVGKAAYLSVSGGNVVLTVMTATTTTLNSLATPATYGDNVTFTALVDPSLSSGTVQFYDNGAAWGSPVALSGGIAAYSTTNLAAGSHPITAAYGGTTGYWPSATASAALQVVNPALLSVIMYPQSKRYGNRLYGNSDGTGYEAQYDGTNWVVIYTTNSWFATGLVNGERLTNAYVNMVPGGGATEPVGAYPGANPPDSSGIFTDAGTATFLGDRGFKVANYMVIRYPADYVITPAPLTITALPQSKAYGDTLALGTTAFVAAGLRNGETVGSVTLTATAGPPDGTAAGDPAGAYTLAPSAATGGTFTESNYTISYVAGTLSVLIPFALNTAFPARVSWASQAGATYTVQYKDDLNVAGWTALTNVLAVGASTTLTDSTRPLPAQRFYRVISP